MYWDLAMGDSVAIWSTGGQYLYILNAYDSMQVDTNYTYYLPPPHFSFCGCATKDTLVFLTEGLGISCYEYTPDSLHFLSLTYGAPSADYHFAALEDSFLYTVTAGDLTCINVADPESIFIYRTCSPAGPNCGLEVIDGYVYNLYAGSNSDEYHSWPIIIKEKYDMINSAVAERLECTWEAYICLGDLAADDEFVYYVSSEMEGNPDWTIGESNLYIWGSDTTYNFDSRWDGQGVFGVDVISENLLAVGFEYGLSILNISNLDSIYEAAYYIDTLGNIDFTHFALKEDRLYAMGHPRDSYATLYMFKLAECVITGIEEKPSAKPAAFEISAYPNPFNSSVTISVGEGLRPSRIEVFDVNGRLIESVTEPVEVPGGAKLPSTSSGSGSRTFVWQPDASLGSGVYLVRVNKGLQPLVTKRVVYLK